MMNWHQEQAYVFNCLSGSVAKRYRSAIAGLLCAGLVAACETVPREDPYVLYRELMPSSILILPPLNESLDANASYSFLTTLSEIIGEQGYYVFPVAVIAEFMRDNGLPSPADMHQVSLAKFKEIIGPDAILYITLTEFGQKFELLSSTTRVNAVAQLVDVDTAQVIWSNNVRYSEPSNSNGNDGLLGDLISAAITQISSTITDKTHQASFYANRELFRGRYDGLLPGPLHPDFTQEP